MKKIVLTSLIFVGINTFLSANDFWSLWSIGEIGGSYSNKNEKINFDFTILQFDWVNTNTLLGIGYDVIGVHYDYDDYMLELFPIHITHIPFLSNLIKFPYSSVRYIETQFFYRTGFGIRMNETKNDIGWDNFINVIGLKIIAFPGSKYTWNKTIFIEYNIMTKSFRAGITIDYFEPILDIYALYYYITKKNKKSNDVFDEINSK
jgi:hypothetical protein